MVALDVHCHFFPKAFLDEARKGSKSFRAWIERGADGVERLICAGSFNHPLTPDFYEAERMIADMDDRQVEMAAISAAPPTLGYWAEAGAAREMAGGMNESIAERVRLYPERFIGLGSVPLQDVEAAAAEARRAVRELGLSGFQIGSHVGGKNLSHPDFWPFFEAIAALDVPLFIHPYLPAGEERMQDYYLHNLVGMVAETGLAIASVIYGGVLERWPGLKLCFAHAGGVYPYIAGRSDHGYRVRQRECGAAIPRPPSYYFRQLYFDSITFEPRALRFLIDLVGSERVVIGSDYPFDMGPAQPVGEVRDNPYLSEVEKEQICGGNAARLFGIRGVR
jgi:aminocarboxymuconate-semialdehyde decarboxylase